MSIAAGGPGWSGSATSCLPSRLLLSWTGRRCQRLIASGNFGTSSRKVTQTSAFWSQIHGFGADVLVPWLKRAPRDNVHPDTQ